MSAGVARHGIEGVELFDVGELSIEIDASFACDDRTECLDGRAPDGIVAARQRPFTLERILSALNE